MKTKRNFEEPELDVIRFEAVDIITASGELKNEKTPEPELDEVDVKC